MKVACLTKWLVATLSPDARITSASVSAEPLTGFSLWELVGSPVTNILDDESAFALSRILALAKEDGFWAGTIVHRTRNGELRLANGMVSSSVGLDNSRYLLVSNLNDPPTTDERDQFVVEGIADKLRNYTHDLNNPLTAMMGFTQLLMLNDDCTEKAKDDLEKVFAELQRVIELVGEMHQYAYSLYKSSRP